MLTDNLDIRVLMESKRIKQKDIADTLGVRPETINRWLNTPGLKPDNRNRVINAISKIESLRN